MICERAPAKLNLFLHIAGRRLDGYHELQSLVVFTDFGDELEFDLEAANLSLRVSGPAVGAWTIPWETRDNSVMKAASALQERMPARARGGAAIHLTKNIPIAAGLGGGSCDAAATLRALTHAWPVSLSPEEIETIALDLGADVPVCLRSRPTLVSGIGEGLADSPSLPELALVIAHTRRMLPTMDVFGALEEADWSGERSIAHRLDEPSALISFLETMRNDLEAPAIRLQPQIADLLADIRREPKCRLARMSGSGAACFGIFESEGDAASAAEALAERGWWAVATKSLPPTVNLHQR